MGDRTYAILGSGALGGFYGARLQKAGLNVHFLLRSDYEYAKQHGLVVESKDGNFELPHIQAYRDVHEMPRCDVVAVALKTTQNHLLPQLLRPVLKDDSVVLVMQNGLGVEDRVAGIVGPERVMGCLCFLCSYKPGPGHIQHLDYGTIELGEHSPDGTPRGITERMRSIGTDFERAAIPVRLGEDLLASRWKKLVWNIPFNGLSVVLNARTDQIMADTHLRALAEALMREVAADATACGHELPAGSIEAMLSYSAKMKPYETSMILDYDRHQPMEIEAIFGEPLRAAQRAGASSPRLEMLCHLLPYLDRLNVARATSP